MTRDNRDPFNPVVINLIGGPCSGKSTAAAGIFNQMKIANYNCELVTEFAKDKVWEEAFKTMDDQIYIFAKQFHKMWMLRGKVDVIITDSPLILSMHYMRDHSDYFNGLVLEQFNKFFNVNIFINRGTNFRQEGRLQNLDQCMKIDCLLRELMQENNIHYEELAQDEVIFNDESRGCKFRSLLSKAFEERNQRELEIDIEMENTMFC